MLAGSRDVAVASIADRHYALVASRGDNGLQIINITNPASAQSLSRAENGSQYPALGGATGVDTMELAGKHYALVASSTGNGLQIINITNPASPQPVSHVTDGVDYPELQGATGIDIIQIGGRHYALIASFDDDGLQIIDVTDPANPQPASSVSGPGPSVSSDTPWLGHGRLALDGAHDVTAVTIGAKHYALVATSLHDGLQIIDITDPTDPSIELSVNRIARPWGNSLDGLEGASSVAYATFKPTNAPVGHYAFVASFDADALQAFELLNIPDPAPPPPPPPPPIINTDTEMYSYRTIPTTHHHTLSFTVTFPSPPPADLTVQMVRAENKHGTHTYALGDGYRTDTVERISGTVSGFAKVSSTVYEFTVTFPAENHTTYYVMVPKNTHSVPTASYRPNYEAGLLAGIGGGAGDKFYAMYPVTISDTTPERAASEKTHRVVLPLPTAKFTSDELRQDLGRCTDDSSSYLRAKPCGVPLEGANLDRTIPLKLTWSKPVTGFDASDLVLVAYDSRGNEDGMHRGVIESFSGSGDTYTFDAVLYDSGVYAVRILHNSIDGGNEIHEIAIRYASPPVLREIGAMTGLQRSHSVEVATVGEKSYAFVAQNKFGSGSQPGLHIFDVTDPHNPERIKKIVGHIDPVPNSRDANGKKFYGLWNIRDMKVAQSGDDVYLFLLTGSSPVSPPLIVILNVTDPKRPLVASTVSHFGGERIQDASGMSLLESGLLTFHGRIEFTLNIGMDTHNRPFIRDFAPSGIFTLDVRNPHQPSILGAALTFDNEYGYSFTRMLELAAVFDSAERLPGIKRIFDSATDGAGRSFPYLGDQSQLHYSVATQIIDYGTWPYAFVVYESNTVKGLQVLNLVSVRDPNAGALYSTGYPEDDLHSVKGVTTFEQGGGFYAMLWLGHPDVPGQLQLINITDPNHPVLVSTVTNGGGYRVGQPIAVDTVRIDGVMYALVKMRTGLQVIDVTDPANPRPVAHAQNSHSERHQSVDVARIGDHHYVFATSWKSADRVQVLRFIPPHPDSARAGGTGDSPRITHIPEPPPLPLREPLLTLLPQNFELLFDPVTPQNQTQVPSPYAGLVSKMYEWRDDPRWSGDRAHTDRWDRALVALGEDVGDPSLDAMTADEAQGYADRGWERWVDVAGAMRELERQQTRPEQPQTQAQSLYAGLVSKMYEWRDDPQWSGDRAHTDRWDRALLALGEDVGDGSLTAMGADEAQGYADRGWERWVDVAAALYALENRAPAVSAAIPDATISREDGTLLIPLSGVFTDADGDTLSYTVSSSDATVAAASAYAGALAIDAQALGAANVTVTASDGRGGSASDTFAVTVKSAPSVASAVPDASLGQGASMTILLTGMFADADGDALGYAAASSNHTVVSTLLDLDLGELHVHALLEGSATVTVTAEDTDGNRASDSFDVAVTAPPPPQQNQTQPQQLSVQPPPQQNHTQAQQPRPQSLPQQSLIGTPTVTRIVDETLLSTILNVHAGSVFQGCYHNGSSYGCDARMGDHTFAHGGNSYSIDELGYTPDSGVLELVTNRTITNVRDMVLILGSERYPFADATLGDGKVSWSNVTLNWSTGDNVQVILMTLRDLAADDCGVEFSGGGLNATDSPCNFALDIPSETGSATFTVALPEDPGADVTIRLVRTHYNGNPDFGAPGHVWDSDAASVTPDELAFNSSNYSQAQTVTVTGLEDQDSNPEQLVILVLQITTGESDVGPVGRAIPGIHVTVADP